MQYYIIEENPANGITSFRRYPKISCAHERNGMKTKIWIMLENYIQTLNILVYFSSSLLKLFSWKCAKRC